MQRSMAWDSVCLQLCRENSDSKCVTDDGDYDVDLQGVENGSMLQLHAQGAQRGKNKLVKPYKRLQSKGQAKKKKKRPTGVEIIHR